jgi:hypothetical protein
MKIKEKLRKVKENKVKEDPNWTHILREPYCMIKTYRGLKLVRRPK